MNRGGVVLQADESLGSFQAGDIFGLGRQLREIGVDDAVAVDPYAALVAVAADAEDVQQRRLVPACCLSLNSHGLPECSLLKPERLLAQVDMTYGRVK